MTNQNEIYKCSVCGNMVEVVETGVGTLVCCGKPMDLLVAKESDPEIGEKHVPVIERNDKGVIIKVGNIPHPMEDAHYIQWIEILTEKGYSRKYLKPGGRPEASFPVKAEKITARIYCNLHGLWKSGV
jgi:superoxide reductase